MRELSNSFHIAKKFYCCDACDVLILSGMGERELDQEELNALRLAEDDHWKILPGMKYHKVVYIDENEELCTYRGRLEIESICNKYDLFD